MKRAEGLVEISRRGFCGGVVGCLGLAASGCVDGSMSTVQTGALGGSGNPTGPDAGNPPPPPPDGGSAATCPSTGAIDVGAASQFQSNTPQYFSSGNFFVVRDGMGLYALTARCTHEGYTLITQSGDFYCQRHGAVFTYNGDVVSGPVFTGLTHYEMCTLANGHVGVVTSKTVAQSQRLNA